MRTVWIGLIVAWIALAGCVPVTREGAVAVRGAEVMPFDLEQTTHIFEKLDTGGRQQVIADDPVDSAEEFLCQTHDAKLKARHRAPGPP